MQYVKIILKYLFAINPGPIYSKFNIPLLILAAILIIGSIGFSYLYKKRKKQDFAFKRLFKKVSNRFLVLGVLLLILLAVRYENIPYFSMRLWLFVLLLALLYFLYKYIKIYILDYPQEKENVKNKRRQLAKVAENKYLPHKKKRK